MTFQLFYCSHRGSWVLFVFFVSIISFVASKLLRALFCWWIHDCCAIFCVFGITASISTSKFIGGKKPNHEELSFQREYILNILSSFKWQQWIYIFYWNRASVDPCFMNTKKFFLRVLNFDRTQNNRTVFFAKYATNMVSAVI